jgi:hypothetical protein
MGQRRRGPYQGGHGKARHNKGSRGNGSANQNNGALQSVKYHAITSPPVLNPNR